SVSEVFEIKISSQLDPECKHSFIFPAPPSINTLFHDNGMGNPNLLWGLFHDACEGLDSVSSDDFEKALQLRNVGVKSLTQVLFLVNPDEFLPIDSVTMSLESFSSMPKEMGLKEYKKLIDKIMSYFPACRPYEANLFAYLIKSDGLKVNTTNVFQVGTMAHGQDGRDFWEEFVSENVVFVGGPGDKRKFKLREPRRGDLVLARTGQGGGRGIGIVYENDYEKYDSEVEFKNDDRLHVLWLNKSSEEVKGLSRLPGFSRAIDTANKFRNTPKYAQTFKLLYRLSSEQSNNSQPKQTEEVAYSMNRIIYGPPGTGKTYKLNSLKKEKYSSKEEAISRVSRDAWLIEQLKGVTWFEVVFAALYNMDYKAKVNALVKHEYVQIKAKVLGRNRNLPQTIWQTLQAHTRKKSNTVQYKGRRFPLVFDKMPGSLWSLVDDWRDECLEQIELAEKWKIGPISNASHDRYEYVTFHQSYSYEDFVEGIRPIKTEEDEEIMYEVVPGVFKRICQRAKADPGQRYAIFIDEINRGNIAKIFGELITLIEEDKRAEYNNTEDLISGMELTLPYSGSKFSVPKNLDIYGTMNTADRSISLIDTALRRRFQFEELMPDPDVIQGSDGNGKIKCDDGTEIDLRALLKVMNLRIKFLLKRDMMLGHAYLMGVENFGGLKKALFDKIIPLLQEYFYEDWHKIQLVFGDVGAGGEKREPQIVCHDTLNENDILGFDHDDFEDMTDYWIVDPSQLKSNAITKVYYKDTDFGNSDSH
ncbi:MAG: AAA family ATPase, partial [Gammaproteobacteria bacterium]|nr:AAA family ATPase [Gammaproteobacteria bacterium]